MPVEKIALLLRIKTELAREIVAVKQAHIEKCSKRIPMSGARKMCIRDRGTLLKLILTMPRAIENVLIC